MKGLLFIRNAFICFLVLVFAGCATNMSVGTMRTIPNINADAIILLVGGKLKYVSPSLSKRAVKGATIVWKIHPSNRNINIRICLKNGSPNPFTDWPNRCAQGNDEIKGTVIDASQLPSAGFLVFHYKVTDTVNNTEIDPPGVIYH